MSHPDRKFPRYTWTIKVKVKTSENDNFTMDTINISQQGMKLISKEKYIIIEPQSIVKISLGNNINLKGEVRHYSMEETGQTVFGIQILEENKDWQNYLNNTVAKEKAHLET
jgi:hypothetical protein